MAAMMQDEECSKEIDEMISDLDAFHVNEDGLTAHNDIDLDDPGLPHILIVTHVPDAVYDSDEARVSVAVCSFIICKIKLHLFVK
jgi:hypothetical protein